jgi:hypothetical protein
LVRNPTSLPFCKAATLSGNTNDSRVTQSERTATAKSTERPVGNVAIADERRGRAVLSDAEGRATTSAAMIR